MDVNTFQQKLFDEGERLGFSEMELYFEREDKFTCHLFNKEIDKYETSEVSGLCFRGIYEGRMGYAFTEKLDDQSVAYLVENAKENSLVIEAEEAEAIFQGSEKYEEGDFYSTELKEMSEYDHIKLLKDIEAAIYAADERVTGMDQCEVTTFETERILRNSKGLSLGEKQNGIAFTISVIAEHAGETKTGLYIHTTRDVASLNAEEIATQAANEALSQLGAQTYRSKKYPVVLRNDAAASLLHAFTANFSAEKAQRGQSLLKDKLGKKIASSIVHMQDDPHLSDGMMSRTFDSEGTATKQHSIIADGTLQTLLHDQKTAKKAGVESTGHAFRPSYKEKITVAPTNLYIVPSNNSYEQLLSKLDEGIVITELSGLHSGTNPISGNFSVAAKGVFVKEGKPQSAVNQMTIAGNFYTLLHQIEHIADDMKFTLSFASPGYVGSPSLFVKELAVTVE